MRKSLAAALLATLIIAGPAPALAATYKSEIIASGLNNPRGLALGPDGGLYVAEAGVVSTGGPTIISRDNVFHLSGTGSITRILGGVQERIITDLPSIGSLTINELSGPADIAFGADGTGYLLTGFIGDPALRAELGTAGSLLGQVLTFTGGGLSPFSDVAALEAGNPAGRELNSNPYHITTLSDGLLVTDAGSNTLVKVGADGSASILATFPARFMGDPAPVSDTVPTGVAVGPDGNYYVAELTGFPFVEGAARIYRVTPWGEISILSEGFTNITDLAFGPDGELYVLQLDTNGLITPGGTGALSRLRADGSLEVLFTEGLVTPTGLEIGADGTFYVTNFSAAEGIGSVLKISAVPEPATWAMMIAGFGLMGASLRQRRPGLKPAN